MQHLVDTNDFSDTRIAQLLADAKNFKTQRPIQLLRDKLLITLFPLLNIITYITHFWSS